MYENQGREQIDPPDHTGCRCNACLDEFRQALDPSPVLCEVCHAAPPEKGYDECAACLLLIELEQDAKVIQFNRNVSAA